MPYTTVKDLPTNITDPLPIAAQKIFLKTFNAAYAQCKSKKGRDKACESVGRIAGWHNISQKYNKGKDGKWTKKEGASE